jgi:multicomponent K+:H+ antiporter subunit G
MNQAVAVPAWVSMITAILLIAGAAITLIGTLGLLRLRTFYERVHAPTLGTTLGTGCIVMASMVYFSAVGGRPILHELLILFFVTVTTPITLMILVRAAVSRDTFESKKSASQ